MKTGNDNKFIGAHFHVGPQKHPGRKDHLWGFDDESIYYDPDSKKNHGVGAHRLQDHPELMHRIMNVCREFFDGK